MGLWWCLKPYLLEIQTENLPMKYGRVWDLRQNGPGTGRGSTEGGGAVGRVLAVDEVRDGPTGFTLVSCPLPPVLGNVQTPQTCPSSSPGSSSSFGSFSLLPGSANPPEMVCLLYVASASCSHSVPYEGLPAPLEASVPTFWAKPVNSDSCAASGPLPPLLETAFLGPLDVTACRPLPPLCPRLPASPLVRPLNVGPPGFRLSLLPGRASPLLCIAVHTQPPPPA